MPSEMSFQEHRASQSRRDRYATEKWCPDKCLWRPGAAANSWARQRIAAAQQQTLAGSGASEARQCRRDGGVPRKKRRGRRRTCDHRSPRLRRDAAATEALRPSADDKVLFVILFVVSVALFFVVSAVVLVVSFSAPRDYEQDCREDPNRTTKKITNKNVVHDSVLSDPATQLRSCTTLQSSSQTRPLRRRMIHSSSKGTRNSASIG